MALGGPYFNKFLLNVLCASVGRISCRQLTGGCTIFRLLSSADTKHKRIQNPGACKCRRISGYCEAFTGAGDGQGKE